MVEILMDGRMAHIKFEGDPVRVAMEIGSAVSGIYQGLKNMSEDDAAMFQLCVMGTMTPDSPVWRPEHEMTMVVLPQKKNDAPTDQS